MRNGVRIVFLFVLSALSTAILGALMALMSAVSLAATTALIVPGTGTPNANIVEDYMDNFWDRYIGGTDMALPAECTEGTACSLTGINYPASFFPLVIFSGWCVPGRCETWNDSVGEGVTNLNGALITALAASDDDDKIVIAGYSQGGAVVSNELRNLASLSEELKSRLSAFVIGNAYNPDGGIFTRLGFLPTIPFLNITFGPAMPVDTGIAITSVGFEYDPVMYAPTYWGNPFAMLNALAAFDNVHGFYLTPNGNGPNDAIAYGYTEDELAEILATDCPGPYCRVDEFANKYYMIPAKSLPIMNLIMSAVPEPLRPFVQPIVDLTSPVMKVLINLGYDWSGDPGQTRWLSPLPFNPFQNWAQVGTDLAQAIVEGIENAFGGGGSVTIAPPSDANVLAMSAVSSEPAPADESARGVVPESVPVSEPKPGPEPKTAPAEEPLEPTHEPATADEATAHDEGTADKDVLTDAADPTKEETGALDETASKDESAAGTEKTKDESAASTEGSKDETASKDESAAGTEKTKDESAAGAEKTKDESGDVQKDKDTTATTTRGADEDESPARNESAARNESDNHADNDGGAHSDAGGRAAA